MTTVLCAGDAFISAASLAAAVEAEIGSAVDDLHLVTDDCGWPDEPFRDDEEIGEWVGDADHIAALAADADIAVVHVAPMGRRVIDSATRLKLIATPRGGPVNVNVGAATQRGIAVANLPGRNAVAVAEYTVAMLIAGPRRLVPAAAELRDGTWSGHYYRYDETGRELGGQTIGLVGLGQIGTRVARMLRVFGVRVLAHDPYVDAFAAAEVGAELVSLDELLATSDAVSVHARLNAETRGLFDAKAFARMRPGAYFVNDARGEIVDEAALLAALEAGHLSGAALDVYAPEPPAPGRPLLSRPDVVATPHLAGSSRETADRAATRIAAEVGRFVRGERMLHCLNPTVL